MPRIARRTQKFLCTYPGCGGKYGGKGDLNRHVLAVHKKVKDFKCPAPGCQSRFSQRTALQSHYNIHTGEKPFICQIGTCRKAFSDPSSCSRHQREVHDDRRYICSIVFCRCDARHKRRSTMKNHLKNKHFKKTSIDDDEMNSLLDVMYDRQDTPDILALSPLTTIASDPGSPPQLTLDTSSPSCVSSRSSSPLAPPDHSSQALENSKLTYWENEQQYGIAQNTVYDPANCVLAYSLMPNTPFSGVHGAFATEPSLLVNTQPGYSAPEPCSYMPFDDQLFAPAEMGCSPLSLLAPPEIRLFGPSPCSESEPVFGYDLVSPFAGWSQQPTYF